MKRKRNRERSRFLFLCPRQRDGLVIVPQRVQQPHGVVLVAAGTVVLVAFAGLGIWAAVNFAGFFAAFHGLFFSQGNWTFPYDSLLICSLPTEFWMGMGAIWLLVSVLASVLSIVVGLKVGKRAPGKRAH